MGLEKTLETIDRVMNRTDMVYIFNQNMKETIGEGIRIVAGHFALLDDDQPVSVTEEELDAVLLAVNRCKRIVLDNVITPDVDECIQAIARLFHNWNVNVGDSYTLHNDVKFMLNLLKQHYTIVHAIEVLKDTIETLRRNVSRFDTDSSISRHYLLALDAIHEGVECEEPSCN